MRTQCLEWFLNRKLTKVFSSTVSGLEGSFTFVTFYRGVFKVLSFNMPSKTGDV